MMPNTCECPYCTTQSGTQTICGVDCSHCRAACDATWNDTRRIPWSTFGPGEYVGPPRREHTFQYFLRVNDQLEVVFLRTRNKSSQPYIIGVGDRLRVESVTEAALNREIEVQPDGSIWLPLVGAVQAAGNTVAQLRDQLETQYRGFQTVPQITVTPVAVAIPIQDVIDSVVTRYSAGGQSRQFTVTPEGTIQMPGIGSVYVQGLTLEELRRELEARYQAAFGPGLTLTPILSQKAPSYVFIGGEVKTPGRYQLEGPTTVMQAIALAGGWNVGGNTSQIVVFRRDENWCLKATKIDLKEPLYGKDPCPVTDVWLRDNDLVIVPKSRILVADDIINLYFTRGVYSAFPMIFTYNFGQGTILATP